MRRGRSRPSRLRSRELRSRILWALGNGCYCILPHARRRCDERSVAAADIEHALEHGRHIATRDRFDERHESWSYCYHGRTVDGGALRVVVAFENEMLVVTVVRLADAGGEDR